MGLLDKHRILKIQDETNEDQARRLSKFVLNPKDNGEFKVQFKDSSITPVKTATLL